jgi:hypothetical protein
MTETRNKALQPNRVGAFNSDIAVYVFWSRVAWSLGDNRHCLC